MSKPGCLPRWREADRKHEGIPNDDDSFALCLMWAVDRKSNNA